MISSEKINKLKMLIELFSSSIVNHRENIKKKLIKLYNNNALNVHDLFSKNDCDKNITSCVNLAE